MSELDEFFSSVSDTELYFRALYGTRELDPEENGRIAIHPAGRFNEVVYFTSAQKAADWTAQKCDRDVFVCVGLTNCTASHSRGTEAHIVALPGLYADIDCDPSGVKSSGHGEVKVPGSVDEAAEILKTLPIQPSLLVRSGGGLHAYWLFDSLWHIPDADEARQLTYGWQHQVATVFESFGYKIDSVFDLARVLRAPGFKNSKYADAETSVYEDRSSQNAYHPKQFKAYAKTPPVTSGGDSDLVDMDFDLKMIEIPESVLAALNTPSRLHDIWVQRDTAEPSSDNSQSGWDLVLIRECIRQGIENHSTLWSVLRTYREMHASNPAKAAKGLQRGYAKRTISKAFAAEEEFKHRRAEATEEFEVLASGPWDDPVAVVDRLLKKRPHIVRYHGSFYEWGQGEGYWELSDEEIERMVGNVCNQIVVEENARRTAIAEASEKKALLVKTTNAFVRDSVAQLRMRVASPPNESEPMWLGSSLIPIDRTLSVQNGILDMHTRKLIAATPKYFSLGRSAATFIPPAKCPKWEAFLESSLVGDRKSIELLQEWFGYVLSEDMSRHKMLMMGGASRSGKGTIGRVLTKLVGDSRTTTPSLTQLGTPFGLQAFVGTRLAFFPDVRHNASRQNPHVIETLLSLTGGDSFNIDRKFKMPLKNYVVRAKLMMAFNGLPDFRENSAALSNRILYIHFPVSFANRENLRLTDELVAELPGILNWSLDGYERLCKQGSFTVPTTGREHFQLLTTSQGQMKQFLQDCCEVGEDLTCLKDDLFDVYRLWAQKTSQHTVYNGIHFARNLYSELPHVSSKRKRAPDGERFYVYEGLKLTVDPEKYDFE